LDGSQDGRSSKARDLADMGTNALALGESVASFEEQIAPL